MSKKILIGGLFAVFMLVTISLSSAVSINTNIEKKESPLFGIRTQRAIAEKIDAIVDNVKTRFIGERIFCVPIILLKNRLYSGLKYYSCTDCYQATCEATFCKACTANPKTLCTVVTCDLNTEWVTCAGFTCGGISVLCCAVDN
jgi:hypothetical protein